MPSVYGSAQLPQQHVGAPFMTPVAVTAQAVRRIPRGAQRLWRCAVAAAARRGAIHDARCQERHKQSAAFRPAPSVYGNAQLPQQHVGAPFITPVAGTVQAVRRIPRGAQRYGGAQLSPPDVVAPFMTPGAVTAQAVRHKQSAAFRAAPSVMAVRSCRRST